MNKMLKIGIGLLAVSLGGIIAHAKNSKEITKLFEEKDRLLKEQEELEFEIKDGLIISATFTRLVGGSSASTSEDLKFKDICEIKLNYENVDTSMIVTSLNGFTAA